MAQRLPLFPLSTVLVPGLVLPLHIFEPRYRQLVADLEQLPEDDREFGVVAIREGGEVGAGSLRALYDVGCAATLQQVTTLPDGRSQILSTGARRFRLLDLDLDADTPYLTGLVEWVAEQEGELDPTTTLRSRALWARYTELLGGFGPQVVQDLPEDPGPLSYLLTTAVVMPLPQRQALLSAATDAERLTAVNHFLRGEITIMSVVPSLPLLDVDSLRS
jgi:Lon protease-like protein